VRTVACADDVLEETEPWNQPTSLSLEPRESAPPSFLFTVGLSVQDTDSGVAGLNISDAMGYT
jgi:hypothetical protein